MNILLPKQIQGSEPERDDAGLALPQAASVPSLRWLGRA